MKKNIQLINQELQRIFTIAKLKFESLNWDRQVVLCVGASVLAAVLIGPFASFYSTRAMMEEEAVSRGRAIAKELAAANAAAIASGRDTLFNVEQVLGERGVKEAFVTDANGLVLAPAFRFHEDARKEASVREALKGNDAVIRHVGIGMYQIASPVTDNGANIGAAMITFSARSAAIFKPLWQLFKTCLLMTLAIGAGVYGAVKVVHRTFGAEERPAMGPVPEENKAVRSGEPISDYRSYDHVRSPMIVFDDAFRAVYANTAALLQDKDIIGKHVMDVGKKFLGMAEELEMLQADEVKREGAAMWRIKENGGCKGYGLAY
jgi:hypothetical protein